MIKKFLASSLFLSILIQTIAVDYSFSITAEERLEEVEKQLIAIANQIKPVSYTHLTLPTIDRV